MADRPKNHRTQLITINQLNKTSDIVEND